MARIYQEALGIHSGDIVRCSYTHEVYEVWQISRPHFWSDAGAYVSIRTWPVISLTLYTTEDVAAARQAARDEPHDYDRRYINDIRRLADGRWFTDQNDEIFVTPQSMPPGIVLDMFRSYYPDPEPYPYQPGVNYQAGDRLVWHCGCCGLDWNAESPDRSMPAWCPECAGRRGWPGTPILWMDPRPEPPARAWSETQRAAGFQDGA